MNRHTRRLTVAIVALCAWLAPVGARAAFEAPGPDPVSLALGGSVAWPGAGRITAGGVGLFDGPARAQLHVGALQWAEARQLQRQGAAVAWPARGLELGASGERLSLAGYSEVIGLVALARPVPEMGWGGGFGLGIARWGLTGAEAQAMPVVVLVGAAPRPGLRVAATLRTAVGPGARRWEERLEAGLVWDAAPGWRVGAGGESRAAGTRLRAGLECRPAPGLALRGAFTPGDGGATFGVGVLLGGLVLDVAQSRHPRLGGLLAAGLSLRRSPPAADVTRRVGFPDAPAAGPAAIESRLRPFALWPAGGGR